MATVVLNKRSTSVKLVSDHLEVHYHDLDGADGSMAKVEIPLVDVEKVVVFGQPAITFPVLVKLMEKKIPCVFLSEHGRWRGELETDEGGFAARRLVQYERLRDEHFRLRVAWKLVGAKIANARRVVQRLTANRKLVETTSMRGHRIQLTEAARHVDNAGTVDVLRGVVDWQVCRFLRMLERDEDVSFFTLG